MQKMNIYTDGAASNNGKVNVVASFSAIVFEKIIRGYVMPYNYELVNIENTYKLINNDIKTMPSNNRGELLGITYALLELLNREPQDIKLYSDSLISVNTINLWYSKRKEDNTLNVLKNLDLLDIIMDLINILKQRKFNISFIHINSHQKNIITNDLEDICIKKILIEGNELADFHARKILEDKKIINIIKNLN
jgi:ribonuclease HI